MVAGKGARKALARALSRVVLSRETILVHAESVLARPDLIQGSLHSPAFELWFAVLQRAEAEDAVERVVGSVLEDNPGAGPLRRALQDWQLAMASSPPPVEPTPDSLTGPLSSERALGSERARWAALAVILAGFVALFVAGSLREPERRGPAPVVLPPPAVPPTSEVAARAQPGSAVQVGAALQARPPPAPLLTVPAESDAGTALAPGEEDVSAGGRVQKRGR